MSESLRRQISSPAALFVFEATARLGSFRAAALELNVTQPSVSYQIKNLEKHLGVRLFERRGRSISLTDGGEILFHSVERGFTDIQTALAEISHRSNTNRVTLCSSSSAAAHFVLPRYPKLRDVLPEIDLNLKIMSRDINPAAESGDFAIRLVDAECTDLQTWRLFDEVYFPLCAPGFFDAPPGEVTLETLKSSNLLYLKERFRARDDWRAYFQKAGSPITHVHERITFSDQQPLLEAAIAGQGVALGWLGLTDHFLDSGSLVKPVDVEIRTERAFYLVAPRGMELGQTALKFRDWILDEASKIQSRWEQSLSKAPA